jgi:hypothetical protein
MSELYVRNKRSVPDSVFDDGTAVAYIVDEMIGSMVSDIDRAGAKPVWLTMCIGVSEEDAFSGHKTLWCSMKCEVSNV